MNDIDKTIKTIKERMNSDVITKLIVEAPQCIRIEEYYKVDNEKKELQTRIDKVLDFINSWKDNKTELKVSMLDLLQIEDILRGDDNGKGNN